jgi:hypothetical protein
MEAKCQMAIFFPLVQLRCGTPDIRVNIGDLICAVSVSSDPRSKDHF